MTGWSGFIVILAVIAGFSAFVGRLAYIFGFQNGQIDQLAKELAYLKRQAAQSGVQ